MGKNKKYFCKYHMYGCGGSVFGKARMEVHEQTCRYAPQDGVSVGLLGRFGTIDTSISYLMKRTIAYEKSNRRLEAQVRDLKTQVTELQVTVSRLTPDYAHIELVGLHLPRYITKTENRRWAESLIDRCKYKHPKHLFKAFMQLLLEEEPFFWKLKSYDIVTVFVSFGGNIQKREMSIRDFAVKFYDVCFVLMKDLWPRTDEINKIPFLPRILCKGFSQDILRRLERNKQFVRAQYARQHSLELHQTWLASIDDFCDWLRDSFSDKVASSRANVARDSLKSLTI